MKLHVTLFALTVVPSAFVGVAYSADEEDEAATVTAVLGTVRAPLGRVASRQLKTATYTAWITDAPRRQPLF